MCSLDMRVSLWRSHCLFIVLFCNIPHDPGTHIPARVNHLFFDGNRASIYFPTLSLWLHSEKSCSGGPACTLLWKDSVTTQCRSIVQVSTFPQLSQGRWESLSLHACSMSNCFQMSCNSLDCKLFGAGAFEMPFCLYFLEQTHNW